jgi:hypothetical protein
MRVVRPHRTAGNTGMRIQTRRRHSLDDEPEPAHAEPGIDPPRDKGRHPASAELQAPGPSPALQRWRATLMCSADRGRPDHPEPGTGHEIRNAWPKTAGRAEAGFAGTVPPGRPIHIMVSMRRSTNRIRLIDPRAHGARQTSFDLDEDRPPAHGLRCGPSHSAGAGRGPSRVNRSRATFRLLGSIPTRIWVKAHRGPDPDPMDRYDRFLARYNRGFALLTGCLSHSLHATQMLPQGPAVSGSVLAAARAGIPRATLWRCAHPTQGSTRPDRRMTGQKPHDPH